MTNLIQQWADAFPHASSITAQWITLAIFAAAFAILGIVARNVWGGLRRPIIQDQPEHWGDDLPWPMRTDPRTEGNGTGVGGGDNKALNTLFSHGEPR